METETTEVEFGIAGNTSHYSFTIRLEDDPTDSGPFEPPALDQIDPEHLATCERLIAYKEAKLTAAKELKTLGLSTETVQLLTGHTVED